MSKVIHTDNEQLLTTYYDSDASPPKRLQIWFEGQSAQIVAKDYETSDATWGRVLQWVNDQRNRFRDAHRRNPAYPRFLQHAHVFAGIPMTADDERRLWMPILIRCLYQVSSDSNPDADSRVAALVLLADILGMWSTDYAH